MSTETTVEIKARGRKSNPNSARQQKLATRAALEAQGLTVARGRKVNGTSARQQRLAAFAARIANGEVVKRGRPKKNSVTAE